MISSINYFKSKIQLLIFGYLMILVGCKKDEGLSSSSQYQIIDDSTIEGITYTDVNGNYFSTIDTTDWKTNDIFPSSIDQLFAFTDTNNYSNLTTSNITLYPGFPNPTNYLFNTIVNSSDSTIMKFVIVDSTKTTRFYGSRIIIPGSNPIIFSFQDSTLPSNSKYRMYYRFYLSPNSYYISGHGDILKQ